VNKDHLTRSERRKINTLKKLDALSSEAGGKEYLQSVVAVEEHEIPSEEFFKEAKKKRRYFAEEIQKLSYKNPTPEDAHKLELLKTRSRLFDEIYQKRLKRENKAKQRSHLIQGYIGTFLVLMCPIKYIL
jgi:hypothetical protein